ncbi:nicotinate phosphoribosyltransferase [Candidatus Saccharibacteria bacterium]|nr:nicotinate phosphoribosyltransferase [Candidatus Saccharibacteria bacterium]MCB9821589.1 nicotinate phosphoribosyltransferase [Candidatus Nomurabacteria bacterium]
MQATRPNRISQGLDYYKPTMSQLAYIKHPDAEVTFELKNRGANRLLDYVPITDLAARLAIYQSGFTQAEVDFLATHERRDGQPLFRPGFLEYLLANDLPPVDIHTAGDRDDLQITATGSWPMVTFWETVVMSELNELYFENYVKANGLDIDQLYAEGDRRLSEKIEILKHRPDIKIAEFGTRRRFSYAWQKHVLERLVRECPDNLIGTSNLALAEEFNLMPIGTFAHELPMVYAAYEDMAGDNPLDGQAKVLKDWRELYDNNLSTALTDTFGSDLFFAEFDRDLALVWQGLRHDSGDPFKFGEQAIALYQGYGIDPREKTIVFSDGLDIDMIVRLADHFKDRIKVVFGWGTDLTNDLGLPANNIVMKAVRLFWAGTVKLSDALGKHTGFAADVARYQRLKQTILHQLEVVTV